LTAADIGSLQFGTGTGPFDVMLTRAGAAILQHGREDAAAPVAQTEQVQSVVAGTTNTAGANWTFNGSKGTGTGAGGSIIFQTAPAGSTGSTQNAVATALTIDSAQHLTVATLASAGTQCVQASSAGLLSVTGSACGGAGGTPAGPSSAVQYNNSGAFGGDASFEFVVPGQVTLALGTITTNLKALTITGTWNAAGVTFDAPIFANITNTAAGANSLLMDLQIGSSPVFQVAGVSASGNFAGIKISTPGFNSGYGNLLIGMNANNTGFYIGAIGVTLEVGGGQPMAWGQAYVALNNADALAWSATNDPNGTPDLALYRDAAVGVLALSNGTTNPAAFRVYNTTNQSGNNTAPTNFERGLFSWSGNTLTIGTDQLGTGSKRNLILGAGTSQDDAGFQFQPNTPQILIRIAGATQAFMDSQFAGRLVMSNPNGIIELRAGGVDLYSPANTVLGIGNGSGGGNQNSPTGWLNYVGQTRVAADVTATSTTTLATITGLSVALVAGRTYSFMAELSWTDAAAGGLQLAMVATGGLTATNIIYDGYIVDSAANGIKGNAQATALGGVVANAATTGTAGHARVSGVITVNVAGTLNAQFAQSVSNATATTIKRGSYMIVQDMP
jgi:hypothetical protein